MLYNCTHKYKLHFLYLAEIGSLLTPILSHHVVCNRFINLTRVEGRNLNGDYVLELHYKLAKSKIKHLGSNHSTEVVNRIRKTIKMDLGNSFDQSRKQSLANLVLFSD